MATPSYWPGGIPREIKHHETDVTRDEFEEQVKGWLLFVRESWVPRPSNLNSDKEYELRQRRALVQQWVSASQEFRDVLLLFEQPLTSLANCTLVIPQSCSKRGKSFSFLSS
jgi:hypothetical protein